MVEGLGEELRVEIEQPRGPQQPRLVLEAEDVGLELPGRVEAGEGDEVAEVSRLLDLGDVEAVVDLVDDVAVEEPRRGRDVVADASCRAVELKLRIRNIPFPAQSFFW